MLGMDLLLLMKQSYSDRCHLSDNLRVDAYL